MTASVGGGERLEREADVIDTGCVRVAPAVYRDDVDPDTGLLRHCRQPLVDLGDDLASVRGEDVATRFGHDPLQLIMGLTGTVEGEEASLPLVTRAVNDLQDPDADRADALLTLADFSYHDDDPASGVEELRAAQEAVRHADVPRLVARLTALIARRAFNEERIDEAIELYKAAIATSAGVLANIKIGEMHVALGVAQERTGKVDDALQSYRAGGALFESEEASAKLADALDLQANAELELGRQEVAAALYERAAGLFETLTRYGSAVDAYLSVSKIEEKLGHDGAVELAMERVLELADRLTDQKEVDEIYQILEASRFARERRASASPDDRHSSAADDDVATLEQRDGSLKR